MTNEKKASPPYKVGTKVNEKDFLNKKITSTLWQPMMQYSWALGRANVKFLEGLKEGKIYGINCHTCKTVIVPPTMFCPYCYGSTEGWVELPDTGKIETFSISYLDPAANRIEEPILIGVIDLDGAPEHYGFMHYFDEMDKDEIHIGMNVKAVWKPKEERTGSITDIKYFKPLKEGGK